MFCPMLAVLFIGLRMRALQITDGLCRRPNRARRRKTRSAPRTFELSPSPPSSSRSSPIAPACPKQRKVVDLHHHRHIHHTFPLSLPSSSLEAYAPRKSFLLLVVVLVLLGCAILGRLGAA